MSTETHPAVSEAMREAVDALGNLTRQCGQTVFVRAFLLPKVEAAELAFAPIASEIARLTGERDTARRAETRALGRSNDFREQARAAEAEAARLRAALERAETPRPISEYHEDMGFCLWWILPVREPPYSGSPGCDDWPEYHTHFTPLPEIRDAAWREAYYATPEGSNV